MLGAARTVETKLVMGTAEVKCILRVFVDMVSKMLIFDGRVILTQMAEVAEEFARGFRMRVLTSGAAEQRVCIDERSK
jgi:hypothetical protein